MRILFLGAAIASHPQPGLSARQKFDYLGKNTGNLLIGQSIFEELVFTEHSYGKRLPPEEANERFDMIVIAAANFIFKNFDFGDLADFIDQTKLPIVIVGLGAQAPEQGHSIEDIPAGTRRLLSIVSDRSKVIGVRGYYTADVMNKFGHKNVRAVGCPSLYRARRRNLKIERPADYSRCRISLNGSRNVFGHSYSPGNALRVESEIIKLSVRNGLCYVLQNEDPEFYFSAGGETSDENKRHLAAIVQQLGLPVSTGEYEEHVKKHFKIFFTLEEWDTYIREFDASVGSRFHGNLIALTNEKPAIIIAHDSRTTEMAELMHIPHLRIDEIASLELSRWFEAADFDAFEKQYIKLYDHFAEFLNENGLEHRLGDALAPTQPGGHIALSRQPKEPLPAAKTAEYLQNTR